MHPMVILTRIQVNQLLNLFQCEPGLLSLSDESKPSNILVPVSSDSAVARRRPKQAFALVEADGFDTNTTGLGKFSDAAHHFPLDSVL